MRWLAAVLAAIALLATAPAAGADLANGTLTGFGVDTQGRAVVALRTAKTAKPVVVRFDAEGRLDGSFGSAGILRPPVSGVGAQIAVQRGGGIVIGGSAGKRAVLRRYRPDGTLDPGFGRGGVVRLPYRKIERILVQPDGELLVLALNICSPDYCGYVYRNLGVERFAKGGAHRSSHQVSHEDWNLGAVGMDPDGGLLVSGYISDLERQTFDRIDPSAGSDRRLCCDFGLRFDVPGWDEEEFEPGVNDLAILPGYRFVVAASSGPELWLHRAGGKVATGFAEGGRALCGPAGTESPFAAGKAFEAVLATADGFLAAGGDGSCGLVRFLANGTLDPGFGAGGTVDVEAVGMARPRALARLRDGRMLIAGWDPARKELRLARFGSAGALDSSFGIGGVASLAPFASG